LWGSSDANAVQTAKLDGLDHAVVGPPGQHQRLGAVHAQL
jgi:hypothetical protein